MQVLTNEKKRFGILFKLLAVVSVFILGSIACDNEKKNNEQKNSNLKALPVQVAPANASPPPGYEGQSWTDILTLARNQKVNWYMWGRNEDINNWMNGYVVENVKKRYGITLNMVSIEDTEVAVDIVRDEFTRGNTTDGKIDLIWINGENFRSMREENLLFGPWSNYLPNSIYVDWEDPSIKQDFGYSVDGYESPYGRGQMVFIYDKARMPSPPTTIEALIDWIKSNPGKFTYPAPPDFNGSAFIRHICYWTAGGYEQFLEPFDQAIFDEDLQSCFETLKDISPYLWSRGENYPESEAALDRLFRSGEVDLNMNYMVDIASIRIAQKLYPETVRTFVLQTGTISNTNYVAIPYNSKNKAGAMVIANYLLSPETQLSKWDNWGSLAAIDPLLLPAGWRQKLNNLPSGPATLPAGVLSEHRLPEPRSEWVDAIEQRWRKQILNN